jgi:CheY-like chemotaxis protein
MSPTRSLRRGRGFLGARIRVRHLIDRKCHVLIVEDHPDTLYLMARLLASRGYQTTTASTVAEAIATAGESWPDVVLSDLDLPDGTGIDLIHQLRARGPVRCVALSGHGLPEHRARTRAAGFEAHLTKPVTVDQIETALRGGAATSYGTDKSASLTAR